LPLTLAVQSLQTLSRPGESQGGDLRAQLDAGRTLNASVKEVIVDTQRPNLFRIKVEAQNMLMELMTSRPLAIGAQVTLGRGGDGALLLSLTGQTAAGQAEAAPRTPSPPAIATRADSGTAGNGLRLQIPTAQLQSDALQRALPLNQPQSGRVLPSVTPPPIPTGNAAPTTPSPRIQVGTAPAQTAPPPNAEAGRPAAPPGAASTGNSTPGTTASPQSAPPTAQESLPTPRPGPTPTQPTTPHTTAGPAPSTSTPAGQGTPPAAPETGGNPGTPALATEPASSESRSTPARDTAPPSPPQPNRADTARTATSGADSAVPTQTRTPSQSHAPTPPVTEPPRTADAASGRAAGTASDGGSRPAPAATAAPAPTPNRAGPNPVQLSVNGQHIELLTPRPLQAGLNVQLTRTDQSSVQLEILPPKVAPDSQLRLQEGLQQILRDSLPQQIPMADALNQLRQLDRSDGGRRQDAIGQIVRSMMSLFSVSTKPDPQSTRQAVEQQLQSSGLMPGAKGAPQSRDSQQPATLKQQLANLEQLGERLPPEARERFQSLLQGIHARTATHQASSLQHWQDMPDGSIERQYRLDLPVRLNDQQLENTEIRITQHKRRDEQDRFISEWSINLHFDLQELGAIDSRISLQQEWQLSARFWAERGETARLIQDRLQDFATQLSSSGFEVDTLHVQQGRQPAETQPALSRRLVDLHT